MRVRRVKPYVCVDCDYAEHFRFQETRDIDAAAGTWLRCLTHSRAQEQDGIVKTAWLRRTFAATFERVEELVAVGLLVARGDGDYEIHAYAPRNQTKAMLRGDLSAVADQAVARRGSSKRRRASLEGPEPGPTWRRTGDTSRGEGRPTMGPNRDRTSAVARTPRAATSASTVSRARAVADADDASDAPSDVGTAELGTLPDTQEGAPVALSVASAAALEASPGEENDSPSETFERDRRAPRKGPPERANRERKSSLVPTSTSLSSSPSLSTSASPSFLSHDECSSLERGGAGGEPADALAADTAPARAALPASERALSGVLWLQAFTAGVTDHTRRPCTAGRVYLGTLERLVTHHAPKRDAASACAWLREEACAFARQWEGKHPAKGMTPDGLERWLNDGRHGPPEFGRPRIVQPAAEDWHEDDWSDLGAEVMR